MILRFFAARCRRRRPPSSGSARVRFPASLLPGAGAAVLCALLALAAGSLLTLAGCGGTTRGRDASQLVVGMELANPPFEMLDERGQPAGISVDLAGELAAGLGRKLKIENIPFDAIITSLKTGRIDVAISSMTVNAEREQSIDFSDPYVSTGIALLVNVKSGVQNIRDLDQPGRTVVTKSATTGYAYAQANLKQATVRVLGEQTNCGLEVSQGKADAFIYDPIAVYRLNQKYPDTTRAMLEPVQREDWAIGIPKGRDELRQGINAFLREFKARKGMERLNEKHLQGDRDAFRTMGFPFTS